MFVQKFGFTVIFEQKYYFLICQPPYVCPKIWIHCFFSKNITFLSTSLCTFVQKFGFTVVFEQRYYFFYPPASVHLSKNLDSLLFLSKNITFFLSASLRTFVQKFGFTVIFEQKYYFSLSTSLHTFVQNQVIRVVHPLWFFYTLVHKVFLITILLAVPWATPRSNQCCHLLHWVQW